MTRADHPTGTDRLAEAAAQLGLDDDAIVVNVQGDEPLLDSGADPGDGRRCSTAHPDAAIATACHPIADAGRGVQSERRQGGARRAPATRSISAARRFPGRATRSPPIAARLPAGIAAVPAYGLYAYRVALPARATRRWRRRRSSASRRWSSCARCGTATGSSSRSPTARRRPGVDTPEDLDARARAVRAAGHRFDAAR